MVGARLVQQAREVVIPRPGLVLFSPTAGSPAIPLLQTNTLYFPSDSRVAPPESSRIRGTVTALFLFRWTGQHPSRDASRGRHPARPAPERGSHGSRRASTRGGPGKSITDLRRAAGADPNDTRSLLRLAELEAKAGHPAIACETYSRAGDVFVIQGFARRALSSFSQALHRSRATRRSSIASSRSPARWGSSTPASA